MRDISGQCGLLSGNPDTQVNVKKIHLWPLLDEKKHPGAECTFRRLEGYWLLVSGWSVFAYPSCGKPSFPTSNQQPVTL